MTEHIISIDTDLDTRRRTVYNINWHLQDFCNYDCSYCITHDNSKKSPAFDRCIKAIDFALAYSDLIVSQKINAEKLVNFNLLGGEPMLHPNIVELLGYIKQQHQKLYGSSWELTLSVMTNGSIGKNILNRCLPFVDFWMLSYHTEALPAQKELSQSTIYSLKEANAYFEVKLMMHSGEQNFNECTALSEQLTRDGIEHSLKVIGTSIGSTTINWFNDTKSTHSYTDKQTEFIVDYWKRTHPQKSSFDNFIRVGDRNIIAIKGSPCCADKKLCTNQDRENPVTHISETNFKGWYCSVNWYFLNIDQQTEEIFFNESCRTNFDSKIGPIGTLSDTDTLLESLQKNIENKTVPVIICPKAKCGCGICAPKARDAEAFKHIMSTHLSNDVLDQKAF